MEVVTQVKEQEVLNIVKQAKLKAGQSPLNKSKLKSSLQQAFPYVNDTVLDALVYYGTQSEINSKFDTFIAQVIELSKAIEDRSILDFRGE